MTTYYVATDGNDTTGDGSTGTPWATLDKAVDNAASGDTIYLRGSATNGNVFWLSAKATPTGLQNLTISGDPAWLPGVRLSGADDPAQDIITHGAWVESAPTGPWTQSRTSGTLGIINTFNGWTTDPTVVTYTLTSSGVTTQLKEQGTVGAQGTFTWERSGNDIIISEDPDLGTVEIGYLEQCLEYEGDCSGSSLVDLTISHYATTGTTTGGGSGANAAVVFNQSGGKQGYGPFTFDSVTVSDNGNAGIFAKYDNTELYRCVVSRNGRLGMSYNEIDGGEIHETLFNDNNYKDSSVSARGGLKTFEAWNFSVHNCDFLDNIDAPGIWVDGSCRIISIYQNHFRNCEKAIFYETSSEGIIAFNRINKCRFGLELEGANDMEVWNNDVIATTDAAGSVCVQGLDGSRSAAYAETWATEQGWTSGDPTLYLDGGPVDGGTGTITNYLQASGNWTLADHGLASGAEVVFTSAGSAPTTFAVDTNYYVKDVVDTDTFTLSATKGGAKITGGGGDVGTWVIEYTAINQAGNQWSTFGPPMLNPYNLHGQTWPMTGTTWDNENITMCNNLFVGGKHGGDYKGMIRFTRIDSTGATDAPPVVTKTYLSNQALDAEDMFTTLNYNAYVNDTSSGDLGDADPFRWGIQGSAPSTFSTITALRTHLSNPAGNFEASGQYEDATDLSNWLVSYDATDASADHDWTRTNLAVDAGTAIPANVRALVGLAADASPDIGAFLDVGIPPAPGAVVGDTARAQVEIAFGVDPFDSATLDVTANWTAVTDDVRSATYRTSTRSDRFSVFSAGNAQLELSNQTRTYDPSYAAGTHFGDFKRHTPIRIVGKHEIGTATFDDATNIWTCSAAHGLQAGDRVQFTTSGTTEPSTYAADVDYFVVVPFGTLVTLSATKGGPVLEGTGSDSDGTWTMYHLATQWYGYAKSWTPKYRGLDSVTILDAVDALGLLADYDLAPITDSYFNDSPSVRITRVLDDLGFPVSYRDLSTGGVALQSTTFDANALAHCQQAALSSGGEFYAQRDGTLTFDAASALTSTRQKTPQDVIGYNAAPTPLLDGSMTLSGVGLGYRDKVTIGNVGGTAVTVDASGANQAAVTFQRTNLLHNADEQSSGLAQFYVDLYGTEVPHISSIKMVADSANSAVNTVLFQRKLRDRITVEHAPVGGGAAISDDVFIDGVTGRIRPGLWTVTYSLTSADAYDNNLASAPSTWMVLDDSTAGVLDSTYRLGY